ncbi:MAG: prepilin-type N-terminal cleavage/methylation domain-containing protein [Patescibacteria group bacterium]
MKKREGFTLLEVLLSLFLVSAMMVFTMIVLDPVRQFAKSRNSKRKGDTNVILNAIGQNVFDNAGNFSCSSGGLPTTTANMALASGSYNIAPCLVPVYLTALPYDPSSSGVYYYNGTSSYNIGYSVVRNATTGRITVSAPGAELGETISIMR